MKSLFLIAALLWVSITTTVSAQTAGNLEYKFLPATVSIEGTLRQMVRNSSDGTTSSVIYVLAPTRGVDIVSDVNNPIRDIVRLQLIQLPDDKTNLRTFVNKPVQVVGVLRMPYNSTQYTTAVIDLKRIRLK